MDIGILLLGSGCIIIFIVYYSYISKQVTSNERVNKIKATMVSLDGSQPLDKPQPQIQSNHVLQISYDFVKRNIIYYGKPLLQNLLDPFL
jgi:hypothetical protein